MSSSNFTSGNRISTRGEDFLITNVVENFDGSKIIDAEGISELVKGKRYKFDTRIDLDIVQLDPRNTKLVPDTDTGYRKTKLFLETHLRNSTNFSEKITIAHKAAFNTSAYQYDPTLKAFKLPRPRILIADAVGLGKTIEAGIFMAEMIKRGKGKRIMVLALKSILGQFQQEIWNRFAIPLVRLDSHGLARIKTELPANKNPFEYYDKTIVSIDTLKNNAKFRHYIEKSHWDIIVIDECHTVANINSQRGDLADFLASKCESLILTSATPHNGKKENFSNLINMIEPTAIPRDGNFGKDDIEKYYVRRFKNDILDDDVRANFQDREIIPLYAELNPDEENVLELQQKIKFEALSSLDESLEEDLYGEGVRKENRDLLFSIGLFKAYMSSPLAALRSIEKRIDKIKERVSASNNAEDNIELLEELKDNLESIISLKSDSKYQVFKNKLQQLNWKGKKKDQRIVVFAERIDTIKYLKESLITDFKLSEDVVQVFHGGFTDIEQQRIIEDFGKEDSKIRILITSDAGSQGVNLHYYCNTMFNYDIPWSLITLEQRNGRIDRYGQKNTPYIYYLIGKSDLEGLKTDLHIIENLTKKEQEVYNALGDAGSVMKLYDVGAEEKMLQKAISKQDSSFLDADDEFDLSGIFGDESESTESLIEDEPLDEQMSLYFNDSNYYQDLINQLKTDDLLKNNEAEFIDDTYLEVVNNDELHRVLFDLPKEAKPSKGDIYRLSLDKDTVQNSINEARKTKGEWAKFQMLYDLHPVMKYMMTKLDASLEKDSALISKISNIDKGHAYFVIHGQVANNIGQNVISDFFAIGFNLSGGMISKPIPLNEFIEKFNINKALYTQNISDDEINKLHSLIPEVIDFSSEIYMHQKQQLEQLKREKDLAVYEEHLKNWSKIAQDQIAFDFEDKQQTSFIKRKIEDKEREVKTIINKSSQYYKDLTSLSNDAYLKIITVFFNN